MVKTVRQSRKMRRIPRHSANLLSNYDAARTDSLRLHSIPQPSPQNWLAMTFIVSLACALTPLIEFSTMRVAGSLQTLAAMNRRSSETTIL